MSIHTKHMYLHCPNVFVILTSYYSYYTVNVQYTLQSLLDIIIFRIVSHLQLHDAAFMH